MRWWKPVRLVADGSLVVTVSGAADGTPIRTTTRRRRFRTERSHGTRFTRRHSYLTLAFALALVAACSSGGEGQESSAPSIAGDSAQSVAQQSALADGRVTFDEYEAGFLRYKDCLAAAGYPLTNVEFDPATQLYRSEVAGAAVDGGVDDECYRREFEALDMSWQGNQDRPGNVDVIVIGWYRDCLEKAGVSVPEGKPAVYYSDLMHENGLDLMACIKEHRGGGSRPWRAG